MEGLVIKQSNRLTISTNRNMDHELKITVARREIKETICPYFCKRESGVINMTENIYIHKSDTKKERIYVNAKGYSCDHA